MHSRSYTFMMKASILLGVLLLWTTVTIETKAYDPDWWKHTIIYQIYPRSFQDSNGDGVGDLKGIKSRLDYFQDLGVEAIWLSPIYKSPMADFGYDVADYRDIDPIFGTMADFDDLLEAVHEKGMYLVMDFVPNHSSDKHEWFIESRKGGRDNPYSDYYIWSPGKVLQNGTRVPPNNWLSIFGGSAWEWAEERQEFYYHQFVKEQPDLNYRNPKVKQEMKDVLRFWTKKGVDGLRIDAIGTMFEVEDLSLDEPLSDTPGTLPNQHDYLRHIYTIDLPEIHDVVREWREEVFDDYEAETGHHMYMVMEIYDKGLVESMKYYHSGADMPFNFNLIHMKKTYGGKCIHEMVDEWLRKMPEGKWANFVLGNHDNQRITSRKGVEYVDALNILLLTLPGTPTTYYGEELGLRDIEVSYEETQDPYGINMGPDLFTRYSRDPCRAPMQWCGGKNSGFSKSEKTWLPVHPDYVTRNVESQQKDTSGKSPLQIYREVAHLRRDPAFRVQNIQYIVVNDNIFSYIRYDVDEAYLIALNLGDGVSTDDHTVTLNDDVITSGQVVVSSGTSNVGQDDAIDLKTLTLTPGDGLIIKLQTNQKSSKDEL